MHTGQVVDLCNLGAKHCAAKSDAWLHATRFLLAESEDALWVAFMGTKSARDLLTNGHILMGLVWPELAADAPGGAAAAHRGYLSRARSIPVEQLYAEARRRGKRLVLCGVWAHFINSGAAQRVAADTGNAESLVWHGNFVAAPRDRTC